MTLYTNSKSPHDGIVGMNSTADKRLLFDLAVLPEAYKLREIPDDVWIPSGDNPADAMTKASTTYALSRLMSKIRALDLANSKVERT